MEIAEVLRHIRPGANWYLDGETYDGLDWRDSEQTKPSLAEIEAAWPLPPTSADVNAERDRRIYLPKAVALSTGKSFNADMAGDSRSNISDLGVASIAKRALGDTSTVSFRDADNSDHDLTNDEVIEMGLAIAAHVQAIHLAARAIKALDPIPDDYADDSRWP